jgi:mannitol operon transcriptional antiterminator
MYLSSKEKVILQEFVNSPTNVEVENLMNLLNLNKRKVYQELDELDLKLNEIYAEFVKVKRGNYCLFANEDALKKIVEAINDHIELTHSLNQRQNAILLDMATAKEPISIQYFCQEYYIDRMTFMSDIRVLANRLKNLPIVIKSDGGYILETNEQLRRFLIAHLLSAELTGNELSPDSKEDNQFWRYLSKRSVDMAYRVAVKEIQANPLNVSRQKMKYLILFLAVSIQRADENDKIYVEEYNKDLPKDVLDLTFRILKGIEDYTGAVYPTSAKYVWAMQIDEYTQKMDYEFFGMKYDAAFTAQVKRLVDYVSTTVGIGFSDDPALFQLLLMHLHAMFSEVTIEQMQMQNPFLQEALDEYSDIAEAVRIGQFLYFPEVSFSDEEVSYVVMHFANSLLTFCKSQENVSMDS